MDVVDLCRGPGAAGSDFSWLEGMMGNSDGWGTGGALRCQDLTTGEGWSRDPSTFPPEILAELSPVIRAAEKGEVEVPPASEWDPLSGCRLTAYAVGGGLNFTIWGTVRRTDGRSTVPIVTGTVAGPSIGLAGASALWERGHRARNMVGVRQDEAPAIPWLALRWESGWGHFQSDVAYVRELAATVAVAWIADGGT